MWNRLTAVEALIKRHRELAQSHAEEASRHLNLAKDFEDYRYELTRPGFKTKGWMRYSKRGRVEPYVVQAENESVINKNWMDR
jgi:hypothetical protein